MDVEKIRKFVEKNNFKRKHVNDIEPVPWQNNEQQIFSLALPLEQHMGIEPEILEDHVWDTIETNDIVICRVKSKTDHRLIGVVLCYDCEKAQEIKEFKMRMECLRSEIPSSGSHENPLFQFSTGDLIRGRVLSVDRREEIVEITMRNHHKNQNIPLGLISEEDLPLLYNNQQKYESYNQQLLSHPGFLNPNVVDCLKEQLIDEGSLSLVPGLDNITFPLKLCAAALRKNQSRLLADKSVAKGLKFFKKGRILESLQEFNHALQMDTSHVDALVARGALFANERTFAKAIADFEFAVTLEPENEIAKSSLVQVLLERAKTIAEVAVDDSQIREVRNLYKRVLKLDPKSEPARQALKRFESEQTKKKRKSISSSDSDANGKNATIVKFCQLLKSDIGSSKKKKHKSRKRSNSSKTRSSQSDDSDSCFSPKKHHKKESSPKKSRHHSAKKSKSLSEHEKQRRSSHNSNSSQYSEKSNKNDKYRRHSESSSRRNLNKSNFDRNKRLSRKDNSPNHKETTAPITKVDKSTFKNILDQINQFEGKRKSF